VTYTIFCHESPISIKYDSMGAAIDAACDLIDKGVVVWRIKGSEGFFMERSDIEIERLRRQERGCQKRP
jgi:hypothetical protein